LRDKVSTHTASESTGLVSQWIREFFLKFCFGVFFIIIFHSKKVMGETGSGKTTKLPQFIRDEMHPLITENHISEKKIVSF
jgi:hypothetical protein